MKKTKDERKSPEVTGHARDWPPLMSAPTVAAYLDVSERMVHLMVADKRLPEGVRVPGARLTRWSREEIDQAVQQWRDSRPK